MTQYNEKRAKFTALSRRKSAIATVNLFPNGKGEITIVTGTYKNYRYRAPEEYFKDKFLISGFLMPLFLFKSADKYDLNVRVCGGGLSAQADAIKLGIAKALLMENHEIKPDLKVFKLLTQDKRCKERKKIGKYGARRSPQFTKR